MDPIFTPFQPDVTIGNPAGQTNKRGDTLGKDEFLRLLVTQLGNQDPLNPMDGQEFAAQLAQFSSVEQLLNISEVLAENGEMNGVLAQSINSGVAAGLIGKSVQTTSNAVNFNGEDPASFAFRLDDGADSVKVTIRNKAGIAVREIDLNGRASGDHEFEWDGLNAQGDRVPEGLYTVEIDAVDAAGDSVDYESFFKGRVDRVTFGKDGIMLWIGKVPVAMSDVESVE